MVNIYDKKNDVPYYIVGSLATLALLASGVFAAAPYVQFLAPIAALGLSAPLIAVCAAFSAVVIAFSAIVVNKNRTIAEKETLLVNKIEEIKDKNKTIAEQEAQLVNKTEEIEAQNQTLSKKEAQLAKKDRMIREEDDKFADSLFNDHNDDAKRKLQKTRQDKFDRLVAKRKQEEASVLSDQSPIAPEYKDEKSGPDAQEDEQFHDAESTFDAPEDELPHDAKSEPNAWSTFASALRASKAKGISIM